MFATVHNSGDREGIDRAVADRALPLTVLALDVTDEESVARVLAAVAEAVGGVDVLVNNAGRAVIAPVEETDDAVCRAVFDTNFFGALRMIRGVLPAMRTRGSGTIVNVSSMSARMPAPFYALYAATKRALEAVSDALRVELAPFGIHVLVVQPGNFRTSILDHAFKASGFTEQSPYFKFRGRLLSGGRELYDRFPDASRVGDPREVADAIHDALEAAEPPLRLPVGADAELMGSMDPDDFGAMVRGWFLAPDPE